ncbi:MAG: hypothetical protein F4Y53_04975 [Proteobacteria bacterium]|nr:hypothetical protein [Pseudomonadota bacterium]
MSTSDESNLLRDLLERLQETLPGVPVYPSDQVPPGMCRCIHYRRLEFNKNLLRLHVRAASDEAIDALVEGVYWALPPQLADKAGEYRDPDPHTPPDIPEGYRESIIEIHF